jgi:riboflavin synthase
MFTGIVAAVGRIERCDPLGSTGTRLTVEAGALGLGDISIGDSVAIQGACMTVVAIEGTRLVFDVSAESLSRTVGLAQPGEVNLEKALTLADRLGGHLVTGHVDGLGEVRRFEQMGESWLLVVRASTSLGRYLAYKGSITVNGVSLTVNRVDDAPEGSDFAVNLIPHTIAVTTLKHLNAGDRVNLEIDLIARYCERLLSAGAHGAAGRTA